MELGMAMMIGNIKKAGEEAENECSRLKDRVSQLESEVKDLHQYISRIEDRLYDLQGHGG